MMRKMFLMGALFVGLVNVRAVGAWAAPTDPKLAALLAMPSDEGCPPTGTVVDEMTTQQQQGPGVNPPPPAPTPCERATKALKDADEDIKAAKGRKQSALDQLAQARERLNEPNLTPQQQFDIRTSLPLYQAEYDYRTGALTNAENARPNVARIRDAECNPVVEENLGPAPRVAPDPVVVAESASFFLPDGDEGGS